MKNLLTLHEAIVLALINNDNRSGTFDDIAEFIKTRNLFPIRKEGISLSKQVMLRSTKSKKRYLYLFEEIDSNIIRLRNLPLK
ncbi:hypothetical protein [Mucilaginibacter aquariorum]|uniref:HTH HARE-type domain-containing protein n=1 Tax=Mucilaginibacter aquariorum TaxID=2967225 RepID=A0ABT1T4Y9_9SPHI|nr:hypothetical protein [Mucilaginibacter aquariorum]MCQ6959557.1 hypothetical protein [Mucilaginibacter aquariorum]